ncbi:MAG: hypothetical protein ACREUC_18130 [Steroidobacteraceae bacterium]
MEFLLLWVDELDDAMGAARHLAPRIVGFLIALALFAATGFALVLAPQLTLAGAAGVASVSLFEVLRRRRARMLAEREPS